jgi:hypothetical protein
MASELRELLRQDDISSNRSPNIKPEMKSSVPPSELPLETITPSPSTDEDLASAFSPHFSPTHKMDTTMDHPFNTSLISPIDSTEAPPIQSQGKRHENKRSIASKG